MQSWLRVHLHALNLVDDMVQQNGFTRPSYSNEEDLAIQVFKRIAIELGLQVRTDDAGNVIARWEGKAPQLPAVATGSHLDTVYNGGGYDGLAGVLCGLGAIKWLKEQGFQPVHPIEVINFRSEEASRFGISTIGSKAMSGILDLSIGDVKDAQNIPIREAVEEVGFTWEEFPKAEREAGDLKCFVELHIEQGTIIEDSNKDYGVVHGVACPVRLKLRVEGKTGHTGTTPMNKRQDALVAIAPLISYISELANKLSQENPRPVVATVSKIDLSPNSMTAIPGMVEAGIDIRSVDDLLKKEVENRIRNKCGELEEAFGVSIQIDKLVDNQSVILDETIKEKLMIAGELEGYTYKELDSGAGHDVMNMQKKWPSGLIFIPCKDGISHHPEEHASIEDLEKGVKLLARFIMMEAE